MRFIQEFDKKDSEPFLTLEKKFIELENHNPELKKGKRFVPVIGRSPANTMIWEAEFDNLEAAVAALKSIEGNDQHNILLDEQIKYMRDNFVEIYKELS